jgi:hypothetical protein
MNAFHAGHCAAEGHCTGSRCVQCRLGKVDQPPACTGMVSSDITTANRPPSCVSLLPVLVSLNVRQRRIVGGAQARTTFEASLIHPELLVEVDAIAALPANLDILE